MKILVLFTSVLSAQAFTVATLSSGKTGTTRATTCLFPGLTLMKENRDSEEPEPPQKDDVTELILEKAIEFAQTHEKLEEDHVSSAHAKLKKALEKEDILRSAVAEAHHDAQNADYLLWEANNDKTLHGEDLEERRELAVSNIAHHVENYVISRLHEARKEEEQAKEEEQEAKRSLEDLKQNEKDLEAVLGWLKTFQKQKEGKTVDL